MRSLQTPERERLTVKARTADRLRSSLIGLAVLTLTAAGIGVMLTLRQHDKQVPLPSDKLLQLAMSADRLHVLEPSPGWLFEWSPDGQTLATASDDTIKLWDVSSGREIGRTPVITYVRSLDWSPDGRVLAASSFSNTIRLINPSTGLIERTLFVPLPEGMPTASERTGRPLENLGFRVKLLGWTSDRILLSFTNIGAAAGLHDDRDGISYVTIQAWDITNGSLVRDIVIRDHKSGDEPYAASLSPDARKLAVAYYPRGDNDKRPHLILKLWSADTGRLTHEIDFESFDFLDSPDRRDIAWSPTGSMLAAIAGHTVKVVDTNSGNVGWSPDKRTFVVIYRNSVKVELWGVRNGPPPTSTLEK